MQLTVKFSLHYEFGRYGEKFQKMCPQGAIHKDFAWLDGLLDLLIFTFPKGIA